jgi:hypothetical protein
MVEGGTYVLGRNESPYDEDAMFRQQFLDLYSIEVATGNKTLIEDRVTITMGSSPGGRYALWFEGDDYYAYDLRTGDVSRCHPSESPDGSRTTRPC